MALDDVTVGDPHASAHNDERHAINQLETTVGRHTSDINQLELDLGNTIRFDTTQSLTAAQKNTVAGNLMGSLSMARGIAVNIDTLYGAANSGAWLHAGGTTVGTPPTGFAGWGTVTVAANTIDNITSQMIIEAGTGFTWVRAYTGNSWRAWRRIDQQDTGWRDMRSLLIDGWTAGRWHMRRVGDLVYVSMYQLDGASATSTKALQMPTGFKPGAPGSGHFVVVPDGAAVRSLSWDASPPGQFALQAGPNMYFNGAFCVFTYVTNEPWPTTLPGTPA